MTAFRPGWIAGIATMIERSPPQETTMHTRTWQVSVHILEDDPRTTAEAVPGTDAG